MLAAWAAVAYNQRMEKQTEALVLFSGGLDSILAARLIEEQGLKVACIHFTSPFFGDADKVAHWRRIYGLNIFAHDVSRNFAEMLAKGPAHGFGSALNPCIDCKILLLRKAREQMRRLGAKILATGEVTGQRPMSQRKDAMNLISREAEVRDVLLRPLCARRMPPLPGEAGAMINIENLPDITGRGRDKQLELAQKFQLAEIPTPAGGCLLTEKENTRRYWQILKKWRSCGGKNLDELVADLQLAKLGRQAWNGAYWLCIGRNQRDNARIGQAARPDDTLMRLANFPGPLALARKGRAWPEEIIRQAASLLASYSPRACQTPGSIRCEIQSGRDITFVEVWPSRQENIWNTPGWEETRRELVRACERKVSQ